MERESKTSGRWPRSTWLPVLIVLLWSGIMLRTAYRNVVAWRARTEIRQLLHAPQDEIVVTVNGRPAPNGGAVSGAIAGVHLRMSHHTYPVHEIPVVIRRKQDVLELTLARDSGLPHEYWIFWTKEEGNPNRLEIGRIDSTVFDGE